ncbi:MAG: hypothetical protein JXK07_03180 [Spirochaetes bacterium]|nr:hypothetical protein [Spirochaetota bacterium]
MIKKGYKRSFVIVEGPAKKGAEYEMLMAGFEWVFGEYLIKYNSKGQIVKKQKIFKK